MSDQKPNSKSASPRREQSPGRDRSRSRSPYKHRDDRSPANARDDKSRSRSPAQRSAPSELVSWEDQLEALYDKGYVKRGDVKEETLDKIKDLNAEEASVAMQRLAASDLRNVKQINGFINGIINRIKKDGITQDKVDLYDLPRSVRHGVEDLIDAKKLDLNEIDYRVIKALKGLGESTAKEALNRFDKSVDVNVRSRSGFLMGIIKRLDDSNRGGSRRGGGDYRRRDDEYRSRDYHDRRDGSRYDDYNSRHRRDDYYVDRRR